MHRLPVCVKVGLPFAPDSSHESSNDSCLFSIGSTSLKLLFPSVLFIIIFLVHRFSYCFIRHTQGSLSQPLC